MKTLQKFLTESMQINESVSLADIQKWIKFSEKEYSGEAMKIFNKHLIEVYKDKPTWAEMMDEGFIEDFLCQDAWDNWMDEYDNFDDIDNAKEFFEKHYQKFFKF